MATWLTDLPSLEPGCRSYARVTRCGYDKAAETLSSLNNIHDVVHDLQGLIILAA